MKAAAWWRKVFFVSVLAWAVALGGVFFYGPAVFGARTDDLWWREFVQGPPIGSERVEGWAEQMALGGAWAEGGWTIYTRRQVCEALTYQHLNVWNWEAIGMIPQSWWESMGDEHYWLIRAGLAQWQTGQVPTVASVVRGSMAMLGVDPLRQGFDYGVHGGRPGEKVLRAEFAHLAPEEPLLPCIFTGEMTRNRWQGRPVSEAALEALLEILRGGGE